MVAIGVRMVTGARDRHPRVGGARDGGRAASPCPSPWRELIVVSLAASAGFTFALFFATSVMPPGPLLGELKLGALATVVGALVALAAARLLHVGRFTPKPVGPLA